MSESDQAPAAGAMNLGAHLEELRWRLLKSLGATFVIMVLGFAFKADLVYLVELPMRWSFELCSDETLTTLGVDKDHIRFRVDEPVEGAINVLKMCFFAGIILGFPMWVYQIWGFVTPGLHAHERRLGFLLVPAGVIFFYIGVVLGYLYGLPFFYKFMHEFNASSNIVLELYQSRYLGFFAMMTLVFGFLMDIPWAILVLVRLGLVTPQFLAEKRKIIIIIGALGAAMLTPPDPYSQVMMLILMVLLFEGGLLASRLVQPMKRAKPSLETGTQRSSGFGAGDGLIGGMVDLPTEQAPTPTSDSLAADDTPVEDDAPDEDDDAAAFADPVSVADAPAPTPPATEGAADAATDGAAATHEEEAEAEDEDDNEDPWLRGRVRRNFGASEADDDGLGEEDEQRG